MDDSDIRKATSEDLVKIRGWLQEEAENGQHSFISNIDLIENGQKNGKLTVLVEDDFPIALILGENTIDILVVQNDRRDSGVGTRLATHWIDDARTRGVIGFCGECSPRTSLKFWKKMGCHEIKSWSDNPYIAMPIRMKRELIEGVQIATLTFELQLPDGSPMPSWGFSTEASVVGADDYMLAEDFVAYVIPAQALLTVRANGVVLCESVVCDIENIGGERSGAWIRVRDLML